MATCWLEKGCHYWEGPEKPGAIAIEVPQRPTPQHVWDGIRWQDDSLGHYVYDKPNYCFVLRPQAEIDAISAEIAKQQVIADNMVLLKFAGLMLMELNAIRAGKPRPQEVTDFIDKAKDYL